MTDAQSEAGLERQPETVRRAMRRMNRAVLFVLLGALTLALLAVAAGVRAGRNLHRAELAEIEARERLWRAYLEQARAVRVSNEAGRRATALQALAAAAAIRPSLALRNEAIASLALDELEPRTPLIPLPLDSAAVGFDPALTRYAIGGATGNVDVFDTASRRHLFTLSSTHLGPGLRLSVRSLAFSPDGASLGARLYGGAVLVWDLASKEVRVAAGVAATNHILGGILFSADGRLAFFAHPERAGAISSFDIASGNELHHAVEVGPRHFRFHPDSNLVAVAYAEDLRLYDYATGTLVRQWMHDARTVLSMWSPDGRQLAVACQNGDVRLWDLDTDTFAVLRGHTEACLRLSFSPDGRFLATGSRDGTSRIWDAHQKSLVTVTDAGVITHFGPDGRDVAVVRPNQGLLTLRLVRGEGLRLFHPPRDAGELLSVDLSPDGRWCVVTQNRGFHLLHLDAEEHSCFVPWTNAVAARLLPDGAGVLLGRDDGLEIRPLPPPTHLALIADALGRHIPLPGTNAPRSVAVSLDCRTALVELKDLRVAVVDLVRGSPPVLLQGTPRARYQKSLASATGSGRLAISPDGRWVACGFGFGPGPRDQPTVWDAATGLQVATLGTETGTVAFSPDGAWLGVAGSSRALIYQVDGWTLHRQIPREEPATTHGSLAWAADSKSLLLTATRQDAHLLDASGSTIATFRAPVPQSLNAVRMARDGGIAVAATVSDLLQIWRLDQLRPRLRALGLDWTPGRDLVHPRESSRPAEPQVPFFLWVLLGSLLGIGVVAAFALVTLRRYRTLIEHYLAADLLARQRSRDLEGARLELVHSQKMKALGTLAAGIAHDFNNLLSVIRMSNKLIGREMPDHPEVREHVGTIEEAVQQGKQVVGSMLAYSRPTPSAAHAQDLDELVGETVALLSKEFLHGITLTLELDRHLPPVHLGEGRLEQVLLNLIVNASEAMQGRGRLRLATRRRPDAGNGFVLPPRPAPEFVELTVEDNGPGIPADLRDRIFEPFFTTKRDGNRPGTGLGLSLVYTIAQGEGLGLALDTAPGQGARFRILIPIQPPQPPSPPP